MVIRFCQHGRATLGVGGVSDLVRTTDRSSMQSLHKGGLVAVEHAGDALGPAARVLRDADPLAELRTIASEL